MTPDEIASVGREEYCARALASLLRAAVRRRSTPGGLFLDYADLPQAVTGRILPHFGIACGREELRAVVQAAQFDAKTPGLTFAVDREAKQQAATEMVRELSTRWLEPHYRELAAKK